MFRPTGFTLLFVLLFIDHTSLTAQDVEPLVQLNLKLGDSYSVRTKGKTLIVDGFREGERVKQFRVNIYDLDLNTLQFSKDETAVIVRCNKDFDDCVTKVLERERKKKTYWGRLILSVSSEKSGMEIEAAFRTVLKDFRN